MDYEKIAKEGFKFDTYHKTFTSLPQIGEEFIEDVHRKTRSV